MEWCGLFGSSGEGAYIHDLVMEHCIFGGENTDAVIGAVVSRTYHTCIERCVVRYCSATVDLYAGGIVGDACQGTVIRSCQFSGQIQNTRNILSPRAHSMGGIVGRANMGEPVPRIEDCCVKAKIGTAIWSSGIASGPAVISRCFFSGSVCGTEVVAGISQNINPVMISNCVCVASEIYCTKDRPAAWKSTCFYTVYDEIGHQLDAIRLHDVWQNCVGRITCIDPTLSQSDGESSNYSAACCTLHTMKGVFSAVDGSLRDGQTVSANGVRDEMFYRGLGWNFDSIWVMGSDGFPEIKI